VAGIGLEQAAGSRTAARIGAGAGRPRDLLVELKNGMARW
jgi:hypothetical protein